MTSQKKQSLLLFVLGFGIFMFTRLSNLVPTIDIAFIIAPILILRFIRTQPAKRGIWLTLLGFVLSMNIALWGLFKFDDPWMTMVVGLVRSTMLAIIWFLPFMLDRLIYPKFKNKGFSSTLIFPVIATAVFYITSLEGPFDDGGGTLSSFSFSYRTMTFMQVRALFGIWILVFMHSWLFAVINYCWEQHFQWKKIRNTAMTFTVVFLAFFVFGAFKSGIFSKQEASETVKIAAVVLLPEDGQAVPMSRIFDSKTTSPFDETLAKISELTATAVENGAKIVSFQEFAMVINAADEGRLREAYQKIADENNTYLSITYGYFGHEDKGENKHLFINGEGEILLDYTKRYLLGVGSYGETGVFHKGPEVIQSVETPYGTIGITICKDMGFPSYLKQAARKGVDIMLSPSYDWPKSAAPWYLTSTLENGFSFVRPTYNGYSYAANYHGEVLTYMDTDDTETGIMYADVPTEGIKVLYPRIGDALGWINVVLLLLLISSTLIKRK